jgi:hypothetical protein
VKKLKMARLRLLQSHLKGISCNSDVADCNGVVAAAAAAVVVVVVAVVAAPPPPSSSSKLIRGNVWGFFCEFTAFQ